MRVPARMRCLTTGILVLFCALDPAPVRADFAAGQSAYARWDFALARREFVAAAASGNAQAMVLLAEMAAEGLGGEKDQRLAFEWFLKAADEGDRKAQSETARRFSLGLGTAKDDAKSLYWTRIAADRGDAQAQYVMGARSIDGVAVTRNVREAAVWLGRAAEQGHVGAQVVLGDLLVRAAESTKGEASAEYRVEAAKWYVLAALQGRSDIDEKLNRNKARMGDADLAEAERRTRAWRAVVVAPPKVGRPAASPSTATPPLPAEKPAAAGVQPKQ